MMNNQTPAQNLASTSSAVPQFVLASGSPRRREMLSQLGLRFDCMSPDVNEAPLVRENPSDYVLRVTVDKARAGWQQRGQQLDLPVLAADTAVVVDDQILGKPIDEADAARMLGLLAGRSHKVLTAVAMVYDAHIETELVSSEVLFDDLQTEQIRRYWQTGEPADKAGGYAIQGFGALFVRKISGSYSAVVGLPVFETAKLLARYGVQTL